MRSQGEWRGDCGRNGEVIEGEKCMEKQGGNYGKREEGKW